MAPRLPKVALKETALHSRARFDSGPGSTETSIAVPKGGLVVSQFEINYAVTKYLMTYQGPGYHGNPFQQ